MSIKKLFVAWYFGLWFICTWLIYENLYPHQTYGVPQVMYFLMVVYSFSLLVVTGSPLYYYFKKRQIRLKEKVGLFIIFLLASSYLFVSMTQLYQFSAINKDRTQIYITDLKNQGFNVEYNAHWPYGHWHVEYVDSYSNFTDIAREINCETVYVHGGVPSYFMFFVPPYIQITAAQTGQGYYIFVDNQYN